jgi:hypothetical protein
MTTVVFSSHAAHGVLVSTTRQVAGVLNVVPNELIESCRDQLSAA